MVAGSVAGSATERSAAGNLSPVTDRVTVSPLATDRVAVSATDRVAVSSVTDRVTVSSSATNGVAVSSSLATNRVAVSSSAPDNGQISLPVTEEVTVTSDCESNAITSVNTSNVKYFRKTESNSKNIRIGLLNINSIGNELTKNSRKKLDFIKEYLSGNNISLLALTEYINTEDNNIDKYHMNNKDFPIISHPSVKRVGLAVPGFLYDCFKIENHWFLNQSRSQKSDKIAQIITINYKNGNVNFFISVIYIAPDISATNRATVFDKMVDLSKDFPNHIMLGDINFNQRITYNKNVLEEHFSNSLTQLVTQITRHSKYTSKEGTVSFRNTTVDLVFVSDSIATKCSQPKIIKKTPSDHYLVEVSLAYDAPLLYTEKTYRLDPLRRPGLKDFQIPKAISYLKNLFSNFYVTHQEATQTDCFKTIEKYIRKTLDIFCPMNSSGQKTMKVYRFTINKKVKVAKNRKIFRFGQLKRAKLNYRKNRTPENMTKISNAKVKYKSEWKRFKKELKKFRRERDKEEIDHVQKYPKNVWEFINKCKNIKKPSVASKIKIKGLAKSELAEHMRKYFHDRALLVSDSEIEKHRDYIPISSVPQDNIPDNSNLIFNSIPAKELYFPEGKKASLACGPDTISLRHIQTLWPAIGEYIQFALDKPMNGFWNISEHFLRTILKCDDNKKEYTEKDLRPICEANSLSKYGPIKAFINSVKADIVPKLNKNQYSLPGKGGPLAIYDMFNNINYLVSLKKPMLVAIWDFSNAFCTFSHHAVIKILKSFGMSDKKLDLTMKFLDQTGSRVKIDDAEGHYISKMTATFRGGPQGQIGVDLMFIIVNDNLQPHKISEDQISKRQKYVDDWADFLLANNFKELLKLFESNVDSLLKGATAVGLKLNDLKTQLMPINCDYSEFPDYYDKRDFLEVIPEELNNKKYKYKLIKNAEILKFHFSINKQRRPCYIDVSKSGSILASQIRSTRAYTTSTRKKFPSIRYRLKLAKALIYSKLDKLGPIYACATNTTKKEIEVAVRVSIKAAGLDNQTPDNVTYALGLGMSVQDIANKKMILLGLKNFSARDIQNARYRVKISDEMRQKPCDFMFASEFNKIDLIYRKKIIDHLVDYPDQNCKKRFDSVKSILKLFYRNKYIDKTMYKDQNEFITKMVKKHIYSRAKVLRRMEISRKKALEKEQNSITEHNSKPDTTRSKKSGPVKNVNLPSDSEQVKTKVVSRARNVKKKK